MCGVGGMCEQGVEGRGRCPREGEERARPIAKGFTS